MRKIFSLLAAVLFAGSMMAESITITPVEFKSSYGDNTFTVNSINFASSGAMYNSKGTPAGFAAKQFIQFRKSASGAGELKNTTAMSLKTITIATQNDKPFTLSAGTAADALTSLTTPAATNGTYACQSNTGEDTSVDVKIYSFNVDGMSYFDFLNGANAQYIAYFTIEYEAGDTPVDPGDEPVVEWAEITFTKATAAGVFNDTVFTVEGSEFSLKCVDTDGKLKTTANNASFGTVEDRHDYAFRLQTGGKSSSKNNMELNIPADGQLRFAVRTATASDETRTVVLVQGTDTIYNKVAVDKDTVKGASNPRIFNFAYVNVKAGKVAVSYPVNGVNFYSFAFKAGAAEEPEGPKNLGKKTIAEFLALKNTTDTCILTGVVSNITNTTYGNFDLYDATDTVYIYGLLTSAGESKKFADLNVAEKDTLTLLAIYNEYNGKPQVKNAIFVEVKKSSAPVVEPVNLGAKTIAEFLALKNTTDTCILTGVVSNITNTTYGNFDLYDATDTVYIYGLLTSAGESKKFADLNVAEKDTLTLLAIYNEYNGKPQVKNAIFVEVKKYVEPVAEHTYTIAGSSEVAFGTAWDPTNAANDMTLAEGIYKWEKKDIALAAGSIKFKVCEDHAWNVAYPAQDYELAIAEAGKYTITITFEPANENKVSATATKTADIVVLPNIILHGNFSGNWADTDPFVAAQDSLTASLTLALAEGNYEFGFKFDGTWKANGANLTREANSTNLAEGNGNMHITADVPGNYVFTYTYETQGVVVTYPEPIIVLDTVKIVVKEDLEWTDAVASQGWWQIMGKNEGYSFSLSNSFTTEVPGIYTVEDLDSDYSFVKPKNGTDTIHFVSGQVVVAINTDSIITFVGALTGTDNKVYAFDLAYDPAAVNPYKYDEKDADFVYDFDSYELNTKYVAQGVMTISAQTDSTSLGLIVYLPQGQTTLVAGEYPVAATPAYQTVVAGYYDAEYAFSGSMAATLIKQGDKLYYNKIWYLVSGKATVDANLNITVDALNSNSKLIKANLKAKAQGIEDVKAAKKATKALKNGILVIEKNGVQYNVTGQEIR